MKTNKISTYCILSVVWLIVDGCDLDLSIFKSKIVVKATPSTYQVNGKQYVVVACGGTKLGTKRGNQYVAFALP